MHLVTTTSKYALHALENVNGQTEEDPAWRPIAAIDRLEIPELGVLARLGVEGSMNMRRFATAANLGPPAARKLHQKLTRLGLLQTDYVKQGAIEITEIRLTNQGFEVAKLLLPLDRYLDKHPLPVQTD